MNHKHRLTTLALTLLLCTGAHAAEDGFSGEASLGFLNTTGNTTTRSLNAKGDLAYRDGRWVNAGRFAALTAQRDRITTDERYALGFKTTYDVTPLDYVFGSLDYDNDRFAGIIERSTEAVGYGRHLLTLPRHTLDFELGAGATQQKLATTEDRNNSFVGLFNARYQWRISDSATFTQTLKIEQSSQNTFLNPVSALKLVISNQLFATLAYEIRTNTEVPVGTLKTDTLTSINIGYNFGKQASK